MLLYLSYPRAVELYSDKYSPSMTYNKELAPYSAAINTHWAQTLNMTQFK